MTGRPASADELEEASALELEELALAAIDAADSEPILASRKPDKFFSVDNASSIRSTWSVGPPRANVR